MVVGRAVDVPCQEAAIPSTFRIAFATIIVVATHCGHGAPPCTMVPRHRRGDGGTGEWGDEQGIEEEDHPPPNRARQGFQKNMLPSGLTVA